MNWPAWFFRAEPADTPFPWLSSGHVLMVLLFFVGVYWLIHMAPRWPREVSKRVERILTLVCIGNLFTYESWYGFIYEGGDALPLYLCRVAQIVFCVRFFIPLPRLEKVAAICGLFGSVLAICYPTPSPFAWPHLTLVGFFIGHMVLGWLSFHLILAAPAPWGLKEWLWCEGATAVYHSALLVFNVSTRNNYAFLREPPILGEAAAAIGQWAYTAVAFLLYALLITFSFLIARALQKRQMKEQEKIFLIPAE